MSAWNADREISNEVLEEIDRILGSIDATEQEPSEEEIRDADEDDASILAALTMLNGAYSVTVERAMRSPTARNYAPDLYVSMREECDRLIGLTMASRVINGSICAACLLAGMWIGWGLL